MDNIRERIYLAALLHDIGKFYQRADNKLLENNDLSDSSKNLADYICPLNNRGNFGYHHVIWTNEFFEKYVKDVAGIKQNIFENQKDDSLSSLACNHHKPNSLLQAIVTLADWMSAGIDRCSQGFELEDQLNSDSIKWGKNRYKQIPLYSVFDKINGGNYQNAFSLSKLSIADKRCFPKEIKGPSDGLSQPLYKQHWDEFVREVQNLPTNSFQGYFETLLSLLKRYAWCIPSNTNDMADVSLYDHLKTTAAFAQCLYDYYCENAGAFNWDGTRLSVAENHYPIMLVGGDLSGIQKFIYNIASRKAAVSLKGRSFYLQLVIDSAIQRIISHPDVNTTLAQVVYSSGGKFYMLLPNTEKVRKALEELKEDFEKELWNTHYGQLVLNMAAVPFAFNFNAEYGKNLEFEGFKGQEIGSLWKCLADKLTEEKNHKFKSVLDFSLFQPHKIDPKAKICAVTGIESAKCVPIEKGEDIFVLPIVKEQVNIGNVLKDADYIITHRGDSEYLSNRAKCNVTIFGISNYLFDQKELIKEDADFRSITSADVSWVKRINIDETSFILPLKGQGVSYGFQFYGGNNQAQIDGRNLTFEELSDGQRLGILRMDVDSLGALFIKGLPNSAKSFSAYSTLSFLLDYFFSGYLNTIREKYADYVNILYSGGDDVFAVGRWDETIAFAEDIRKDFAQFVGRDDISISGGIAMVGDKFPIAKAAEIAGDAEDKAKKFNNQQKNALNVFGESISWKDEFEFVKNRKKEFVDLCDNANMPKSILHRLMILCTHMRSGDMSYIWHTAYYLKRFAINSNNEEVKSLCTNLQKELCDKRKYELTAIAARWAELKLKYNHK